MASKETPAPKEAEPVAEKSDVKSYFFPDIDGQQVTVKATSQDEARKKAEEIARKGEK